MGEETISDLLAWEAWLQASAYNDPTRLDVLLRLGWAYGQHHETTGEMAHLEKGIRYLNEALVTAPQESPAKASGLFFLGAAYCFRYKQTNLITDIDMSVDMLRQAVELSPARNGSERPDRLYYLADVQMGRYRVTNAASDRDEAIQNYEECLTETSEAHPLYVTRLQSLYLICQEKYMATGDNEVARKTVEAYSKMFILQGQDASTRAKTITAIESWIGSSTQLIDDSTNIQRTVHLLEGMLDVIPPGDLFRADMASAAGWALLLKFHTTMNVADVNQSIQRLIEAVHLSEKREEAAATNHVYRLGTCYGARYDATGSMEDLEACIGHFERTLDALHSKMPRDSMSVLGELGRRYLDRFAKMKKDIDANIGIQRLQESIEATPHNDPEMQRRCQYLSIAAYQKYTVTKEIRDLDMAIEWGVKSCSEAEKHGQRRSEAVRELAKFADLKYSLTNDTEDCDANIRWTREAIILSNEDQRDRTGLVQILFGLLINKYADTSDKEDIKEAALIVRDILEAIPELHPLRSEYVMFLEYLNHRNWIRQGRVEDLKSSVDSCIHIVRTPPPDGLWQGSRLHYSGLLNLVSYSRSRMVIFLDAAVELLRDALSVTADASPDRPGLLYDLAAAYQSRYFEASATADLTIAIRYLQEAVLKTPEANLYRARYVHALGMAHLTRYQRFDDVADLDAAIQRYQEALGSSLHDDSARRSRLRSAGIARMMKYRLSKESAHLKGALKNINDALALTPEDHPHHALGLQDLGIMHFDQFQDSRNIRDLDLCIEKHQKAYDLTPDASHHQADQAFHLGSAYLYKYLETNNQTDVDAAVEYLRIASMHALSSSQMRLLATQRLMSIFSVAEDWEAAYEVASNALSMVHLLTPRLLDVADKQYILTRNVYHLASDAAAIALMAGRSSYEAIRLLELGRGLILGSLEEARVDISDLKEQHPELAAKYMAQRHMLDSATKLSEEVDINSDVFSIDQTPRVDQRYNASQELTLTVEAIREQPGFSRFLLLPTEEELRTVAVMAPIVIINVSRTRSDALIIETSGLKTIPLSRLHFADMRRYEMKAEASELDCTVLEWLWDSVAEPVLEALGISGAPTDAEWPRVRWIPTGAFAKFPLHAAEYHDESDHRSVLDRAISVYSFSLRSLVQNFQAQNSKRGISPSLNNIVLVGAGQLPSVPVEMNLLKHLWRNQQVRNPSAFRDDVLEEIKACDVFHFAGHGYTDRLDPLRSALILERKERLTVSSLFEMNLHQRRPYLAYLSACGTGRMKHDRLMDEGLHLIVGFQLAGFQHVIGTLWDVDDESCAEAARLTYEWIQQGGGDMTDELISQALHHAVRKLRAQWISNNSIVRKTRRLRLEESQHQLVPHVEAISKQERLMSEVRAVLEHDPMSMVDEKSRHLLTRDLCGDVEEAPLHWVPYVHYGL